MPRLCAVKNCPSRRHNLMKRREELNLKRISLFQVPKCTTLRQQWIQSLGIELTTKHSVCELHFAKDDVFGDYDIPMKHNSSLLISKERTRLRRRAVPLSNANSSFNERHHQHESTKETRTVLLQQQNLQYQQQEESNQLEQQNSAQTEQKDLVELEQEDLVQLDQDTILQQERMIEEVTVQDNNLTIHDLISGLNELLPGWCYLPGADHITFINLDSIHHREKIKLRIDADLTVMATFYQNFQMKLDVSISSLDDLLAFLKTFERKTVCRGSGLENNRYSTQCSGIISYDNYEYKRHEAEPRCKACRILRQRLRSNAYRQTKRKERLKRMHDDYFERIKHRNQELRAKRRIQEEHSYCSKSTIALK